MRTGKLYIDGNDAYLQYGVYVTKGGYNELVAFPPLKAPKTNDWHEEDGIEADLENPVLDGREVTVSFAVVGIFNRYTNFISLLSDRAYHVFEFAEIKRTFKLRLVSNPKGSDDVKNLGLFTLKFADDYPMQGTSYKEAVTPTPRGRDNRYLLDGKSVADYGVTFLKGINAEMSKIPEVKTNLVRKSQFTGGREYDDRVVTFKSKDAKIDCLLRAKTLEELWKNYAALLHDLTQPDERELYIKEMEHAYPFFYKSCKVSAFYPEDDIWLQFTLTITITGNLRLAEVDGFILASEDFNTIITETGSEIDLTPNRNSYPSVRLVNNRNTLRLTGSGNFRFNN